MADNALGARNGTSRKKLTERWKRERDAVAARARRRRKERRRIRNQAGRMKKGASRAARTGKTKMQERTRMTARARSGPSSRRKMQRTSGMTTERPRTERLGEKGHGAEKESVTSRGGPGLAPDRGDTAGEKGHATGVRAGGEAAAETGNHADQKAGIKETETERRRRATLNRMTRRAKRTERETRALKSGLVKNAAAEREAPSGDGQKAAAARTATRTGAKRGGNARARKPPSEQKTNPEAPRRITKIRKGTQAPATVTNSSTAHDHHVLQMPHPDLRTAHASCVNVQYDIEVGAQSDV